MSTPGMPGLEDMQVDVANLYREEQVTDLKVGSIQCLVPIKPDGSDDPSRETTYVAQTQIMSQMGPLPISGPIEATNLAEAVEKFPEAIQAGINKLVEEAQERQREEANRIVTPGDLAAKSDKSNLIL